MPSILAEKDRVARKQHCCSLCNGIIEKGETYEWSKLVYDGQLYEWKNHKKCGYIAQQLWSYIDPDEGMTEEDFAQGCWDFCSVFICPDCKDRNNETDECDYYYCLDKIYDFLQTHDFRRVKENGNLTMTWECVPKDQIVS